jgi:hypothetical protein
MGWCRPRKRKLRFRTQKAARRGRRGGKAGHSGRDDGRREKQTQEIQETQEHSPFGFAQGRQECLRHKIHRKIEMDQVVGELPGWK